MDLKMFRVLEVIVRAYSRQPAKRLIDHYLRIRIMLKIPHFTYQQLFTQINLSSAEQAIIGNKSKESRSKQFVCLVVDHPLGLPLSSLLLQQIQECIIINDGGQCNNILGLPKTEDTTATRCAIIKVNAPQFDELTQNLDAYLSICEVFMGHLHLVVSCFEGSSSTSILQELKPVEGDEFVDFRENGYFRILQERASKITLEELSDVCRIERQPWGELLVFEGGQECLIVWITHKRLPLLGVAPCVRLNSKKQAGMMPIMLESELGLKVFKQKELMREKLEDLETTTIIFNVKEQYNQEIKYQISTLFEAESSAFFSKAYLQRDSVYLQQNIGLCEKVCQILDLSVVDLLKKLMKS